MNLNGRGPNEVSVAGSLLATRLGEVLISKGVLTTAEAAQIVQAAIADATAPQGWDTGTKAAGLLKEVGEIWDKA